MENLTLAYPTKPEIDTCADRIFLEGRKSGTYSVDKPITVKMTIKIR